MGSRRRRPTFITVPNVNGRSWIGSHDTRRASGARKSMGSIQSAVDRLGGSSKITESMFQRWEGLYAPTASDFLECRRAYSPSSFAAAARTDLNARAGVRARFR